MSTYRVSYQYRIGGNPQGFKLLGLRLRGNDVIWL
jgi:hypothetical protein